MSLTRAYALAVQQWGRGARAGTLDGECYVGRYWPLPVLRITGATYEHACRNAGLIQ